VLPGGPLEKQLLLTPAFDPSGRGYFASVQPYARMAPLKPFTGVFHRFLGFLAGGQQGQEPALIFLRHPMTDSRSITRCLLIRRFARRLVDGRPQKLRRCSRRPTLSETRGRDPFARFSPTCSINIRATLSPYVLSMGLLPDFQETPAVQLTRAISARRQGTNTPR